MIFPTDAAHLLHLITLRISHSELGYVRPTFLLITANYATRRPCEASLGYRVQSRSNCYVLKLEHPRAATEHDLARLLIENAKK